MSKEFEGDKKLLICGLYKKDKDDYYILTEINNDMLIFKRVCVELRCFVNETIKITGDEFLDSNLIYTNDRVYCRVEFIGEDRARMTERNIIYGDSFMGREVLSIDEMNKELVKFYNDIVDLLHNNLKALSLEPGKELYSYFSAITSIADARQQYKDRKNGIRF